MSVPKQPGLKWMSVTLGVESQELIFIRGAEGRADRGADREADTKAEGPMGRGEGR